MSTEKNPLASAIAELRSAFDENQQKFSDRFGVGLATVARWEIGERNPSPRYLKELWHLAAEQDKPELAKIFADAFALSAGYALSSGESGFLIRRLVSDILSEAGPLLHEQLPPEARTRVGNILRMTQELRGALRELDIEPPFRTLVQVKKGKK
jgi:transcriptional regulator with XRE-family HTH domain